MGTATNFDDLVDYKIIDSKEYEAARVALSKEPFEFHACVFSPPLPIDRFVWVSPLGIVGRPFGDEDVLQIVALRLLEGVKKKNSAEQTVTGQPAARPESKPEGSDRTQPVAEGRSISPVAGEEPKLGDAKIGDYIRSGNAAGFLKYRGVHSGVTIYALSADVGSAMPSEDFRLYAKDERSSGPLFSLGLRSREGYRCVVDGDTLRLFVTQGLSREEVSKVPIVVIDLKQLISDHAKQEPEGGAKPQPEAKGRSR